MFALPIHAVTRVLVIAGMVLVGLSAVALLVHELTGSSQIAGLPYLQMLRVDRETNNLPAWYSSGLLFLCGCSLACVAMIQRAGLRQLTASSWSWS